jgi:hypothetical protein
MYVHCNTVGRFVTIVMRKSSKYCTLSVFVAFFIKDALRLWRIILFSVACLSLQDFFPIFRINGTTFGKRFLSVKYAFRFSLQLCLKHFSFY